MPGRMTRSAPQSPFELPEVTAVVRATHLSGQNAGKAQKFTPVRGSSGESRSRGASAEWAGRIIDHLVRTGEKRRRGPLEPHLINESVRPSEHGDGDSEPKLLGGLEV